MEVLLLHAILLLVLTYPSAAVENVSGDLHSPLKLTTSFSPYEVKEVSWKHESNGTESRIAIIRNGSIVDDHGGYGQYGNGTTLEIKNLTEKDQGIYTADVTFLNDIMETKSFNVSLRKLTSTHQHPSNPRLTISQKIMAIYHIVGQPSRLLIAVSQSSINLVTSFDPDDVKDFTWTHQPHEEVHQIIKIQNDQVVDNHNNRYKPLFKGTTLGIDDLAKSDSGLYTAEVTLLDDTMVEVKFNVTVLDPIPPAQIKHEVKRVEDQCNVNLHCSVPSNTAVISYTWKYRHQNSEYQTISNTENKIQRALSPDQRTTEFMCIVQNPADQKNVTVLINHCSELTEVKSNTKSPVMQVVTALVMVAVVEVGAVVLLVASVFGVALWNQKSSKRSS